MHEGTALVTNGTFHREFLGLSEAAANQAALAYRLEGEVAHVEQFLPGLRDGPAYGGAAIVLPALRRVECVLDGSSDLADATKELVRLTEDGWSVWAVVPLHLLGVAH